MNSELLNQLQSAQRELDPRFKALRSATSALQAALRLASDEQAEALDMQRALTKLRQATTLVEDERLQVATQTFEAETQKALDALAFEFARDLKHTFEQRGQAVSGRPPTLVVEPFVLQIDIAGRKAQWFYGKEPLTRPLPLSISAITKAYEQQRKLIAERNLDVPAFLAELYQVWQKELDSRTRRPAGNRLNLVEIYGKVVMGRQSSRFWNAPSRNTFKDYQRPLFVRDLVLAQAAPSFSSEDGQRYRLRLGTATKSQADSPGRSIWVPNGPLDGEYYADIVFEAV
jgi:hypothetical protein